MTRLYDMFYGPMARRSERADQRDSAVQEIVILDTAARALTAQLQCPGQCRSGLLFGALRQGVLSIHYAAASTPPGNGLSDALPLAIDDAYAIGWADALTATHSGQLDWCGMWLMEPNAQMHTTMEQLRWAQQAYEWGLLTEEMVLLLAGWDESHLSASAYIQQDEPTIIPVQFGGHSSAPPLAHNLE